MAPFGGRNAGIGLIGAGKNVTSACYEIQLFGSQCPPPSSSIIIVTY